MFLVNVSPPKPLDVATSNCAHDVEGSGQHFMWPKVKGKIKHFLVNASPPNLLNMIATSNFVPE